jgi:hypothetical protein
MVQSVPVDGGEIVTERSSPENIGATARSRIIGEHIYHDRKVSGRLVQALDIIQDKGHARGEMKKGRFSLICTPYAQKPHQNRHAHYF